MEKSKDGNHWKTYFWVKPHWLNRINVLADHISNGFGWQTSCGELKASVFQLHTCRDFYGANMMLDTAPYLTLIVAPRAIIINNIVAQHAPLNQRPVMCCRDYFWNIFNFLFIDFL
ncbi:hypothetical protein BB558_004066 [Smittium angustum]|uniref:Uncharacterized protein n=1 Tax=Smittium angustum TaxID=133377 RepID=A0A2U1IZB2_SMIAN|nr:hypothetical protein BB558_005947 [Smittium angustum]PVZ99908.1 hypothetical protein BB558_004066 [Smittium angustum]